MQEAVIVLHNLRLVETGECISVGIWGNRIAFVQSGRISGKTGKGPGHSPRSHVVRLDMDGALVFPGLVNSHDHLEFNSFPALGMHTYDNYVEWGETIHAENKEDIDRVLRIPAGLRARWGLYKNLLGGVTTVLQHGRQWPFGDLVDIHANCQCIHSVRLETGWRKRLNDPRWWGKPCVIHIGEGTDAESAREIDFLLRWNWLKRPLVGVHGVAMTAPQARHFAALVWCPYSNLFLLGRTAPVDQLRQNTRIIFGTDSTLTGPWNIWDHQRCARKTGLVSDKELFDMLTLTPAATWGLGGGLVAPGRIADLTIARPRDGQAGWDGFYGLDPENIELVFREGKPCLADTRWKDALQAAGHRFDAWSAVEIGGTHKYVPGDLPGLAAKIRSFDARAQFPFPLPT